jgi:hypothetical protein
MHKTLATHLLHYSKRAPLYKHFSADSPSTEHLHGVRNSLETAYSSLAWLRCPTHDYPRSIKKVTASSIRAINQEITQNLVGDKYSFAAEEYLNKQVTFYPQPSKGLYSIRGRAFELSLLHKGGPIERAHLRNNSTNGRGQL